MFVNASKYWGSRDLCVLREGKISLENAMLSKIKFLLDRPFYAPEADRQ